MSLYFIFIHPLKRVLAIRGYMAKILQKPNTDACILVLQYNCTIHNPQSTQTWWFFFQSFSYRKLFPYCTSLSSLEVFQWLRFCIQNGSKLLLFERIDRTVVDCKSHLSLISIRKQFKQSASEKKRRGEKKKLFEKSSINEEKKVRIKYVFRLVQLCWLCYMCFIVGVNGKCLSDIVLFI